MPLRFRQIHLDFHTSPDIDGVGADFDPDEFAETLARAHVDSVTSFARCHHGHLYYPSAKFPERIHPHLARPNLLGEQIEACHRRGIRVPIYVTVQWDQYTADRHRDWLLIDAEGKEMGTAPFQPGFYRNLDVFHPEYRQFLFDHVGEILDTLPVDGIFFDIVQPVASCALHWKEAMDRAGLNPESAADRGRFAITVMQDWEREMSAFVRERAPEATLFYNSGHVGPRHRPVVQAYSHFELESLPSGGWGYTHFPQSMRYARTLGNDCLGMTGKFHTSWGDFGSYKNPAALQFECFQMLALGAKCSIGDQLPPRGRLDAHTYDLVGGVYAEVERREPFCAGAEPVNEVAVLTSEAFVSRRADFGDRRQERNQPSVTGALRMLQELGVQFDLVDDTTALRGYKVLILPDEVPVEEDLGARLQEYVANGGALIASHSSGLPLSGGGFSPVFSELFGVRYAGDAPFSPDFLVASPALAQENTLPAGVPHVMYRRAVQVEVSATDAEVLATLEAPYFNRTWRHFCSHAHAPSSGKDAGYPAVVRRGSCIYFAHPIFHQYQDNAPRWCKSLLAGALDLLLPERLVDTQNAPSSLLTALNRQPEQGRYVLHLLHYIAERRCQSFDIVEDVIPLFEVGASIRVPETITGATLEPAGTPLPVTQENGRARVTVPRLDGHAMVVFSYR